MKIAQERNTMIRKAQTARIIITCGYCMMMIVFILITVLPICGISMRYLTNITDPGKLLPLPTYHAYDVTRSPQYELTFVLQTISMIFAAMSYTGIDNFLGLLVFHICGQLEILRNRIEHLDKFANIHYTLKSNVEDHTRLLKYLISCADFYILSFFSLYISQTGKKIAHYIRNMSHLILLKLCYLSISISV